MNSYEKLINRDSNTSKKKRLVIVKNDFQCISLKFPLTHKDK